MLPEQGEKEGYVTRTRGEGRLCYLNKGRRKVMLPEQGEKEGYVT